MVLFQVFGFLSVRICGGFSVNQLHHEVALVNMPLNNAQFVLVVPPLSKVSRGCISGLVVLC